MAKKFNPKKETYIAYLRRLIKPKKKNKIIETLNELMK